MAKLLTATGQRSLLGKLGAGTELTLAGATNASPSVFNVTAHGLVTGDVVAVYGVTGNTAINHVGKITVTDANHFTSVSLQAGTAINGNGTTSGGKVVRVWNAMVPHDLENTQNTLRRMKYAKQSDAAATDTEATLKTTFGA